MTCPIAQITSSIALSTENCPDNQCFDAMDKHHQFNKVCIQTAIFNEENFDRYCRTDTNAQICKNYVTTKNEFSQFINSGSVSS